MQAPGEEEVHTKKEKAERYEQHRKSISDKRGRDNAKGKGVPPVKIDRERAAGKSASVVRSEVHVVGKEETTPAKTEVGRLSQAEMKRWSWRRPYMTVYPDISST